MLDRELSWTWLHRSCRSLNIGGFSNNLTTIIKQFYLFVSLPKTLSFTHTLPSHLTHYCSGDLGTLSLGIPYHTSNATKVARETSVFFLFVFFFLQSYGGYLTVGVPFWVLVAELWGAKRACGAPWVSKSTHPRKFGNHVTVHRPPAARPSAPQGNQCSISHFLASLGAQED